MTTERRTATDAEAKALASTLRMRILRACLADAHTNKEIAEALGRDPATTLHHVRTLVDTGFLEAQPVRRGSRGSREIPYLATGKSWHVEVPGGTPVLLEAFLEELGLVPVERVRTSRMGLRLTAGQLDELQDRITDIVIEYVERQPEPGAEAWSVFLAIHPDPNRPGTLTSSRDAPGRSRSAG